jgi:hypothetical protein
LALYFLMLHSRSFLWNVAQPTNTVGHFMKSYDREIFYVNGDMMFRASMSSDCTPSFSPASLYWPLRSSR